MTLTTKGVWKGTIGHHLEMFKRQVKDEKRKCGYDPIFGVAVTVRCSHQVKLIKIT
jgi:hypothetical protein